MEFIGGFQRVLEAYLSVRGLSIGPGDCYVPLPAHIRQLVVKTETHVDQFAEHLPQAEGTFSEAVEANVCLVMDKCRDLIGDYVMEQMAGTSNGLDVMVRSGAKGNKTNIIQTSGIVGQQRNHQCMRLPDVITGFLGHPAKAKAHGFITSSFIQGLKAHEYFAHLVGSRVGLVDTSVKTSAITSQSLAANH